MANFHCFVVICIFQLISSASGELPLDRKLLPLGKHKGTENSITYAGRFPSSTVFYRFFVKTELPLLMKKVLSNDSFPIIDTWTDEYLIEKYGKLRVRIEQSKKENRTLDPKYKSLRKYLSKYKTDDIYMVQSIPSKMQGEVNVPYTLHCGGFQKALQDSVLWLSSGGTRSVLHYDGMDNFNCVLDGEKTVLLFDTKYKDLIEAEGFVQKGSYSNVDVDAVDPQMFPSLMKANWTSVSVGKGDCLYIPHRWYHQFRSSDERSLAINFWFSHLWWFNESDCTRENRNRILTLKELQVKPNNEHDRSRLLAKWLGKEKVSRKEFLMEISQLDKEVQYDLFNDADADGDGNLSWPELYSFDIKNYMLQTLAGISTNELPGCKHTPDDSEDMKIRKYPQQARDEL